MRKLISIAAAAFIATTDLGLAAESAGDLTHGLRHPLASTRQTAAEAIGDLGVAARPAEDALLRALQDDNVEVRRAVLGSLARVGLDGDKAERLLPALRDSDWMVRERAAKLLASAEIHDPGLIRTVMGLLKAEDWSARRSAAIALSGADPDRDDTFTDMIAALSDRMLTDEQWQVRSTAAYAIGRQGRRAQAALADLFDVLRYDEPMVAEVAIEAIGRIGPSGLDVALTDSFPSVRLAAARIVGTLNDRAAEAAPALAKVMNERSVAMRRTAAIALGTLGPSAAGDLASLVTGLKDDDWSVRWASARALGKLGPAAGPAVRAVADALRDPDSRVCEAAAFALEGIGPMARDSVGALAMAVREQPIEVCRMIDVTATTQESQMDLGWTVRWAAARALGAIDADAGQTIAALQGALADSMWQVRGVAALSLGRVKNASSAKTLLAALNDDIGPVRKAAAMSLGEIGPSAGDAIPFLRRALNDADASVQEAARAAIPRIERRSDPR